MKRKLLWVVALAFVAGTLPGLSQAQMVIPFIGGGAAFGSGDLADNTDTGWLGFAGIDYTLRAMPGAAVGVTVSYAHIPYKGNGDDATNITGGTVDLAYAFGAASGNVLQPYVRAGIGVLQHKYDVGGNYGSESETKFGGSAGAGINLHLGSAVTPFAGVHFVTGGSETQYYTVYAGLSFVVSGAPAPSAFRGGAEGKARRRGETRSREKM